MGKRPTAAANAPAPKKTFTNTTHVKGTNFYHDAAKVKMRNMLKSGRPTRDTDGKIVKAGLFQSRLPSGTVARVQPDRRWFENTRVIGQKQLESFKDAMATKLNDPYAFVMRTKTLPMSLLTEYQKVCNFWVYEKERSKKDTSV
jgi:nuclear GTP-binding protein